MKRLNKFLVIALASMFLMLGTASVSAQSAPSTNTGGTVLCTIFPFLKGIERFGVAGLCGGNASSDEVVNTTKNFVTLGISLVFVGIIVVAIFVIIKSAITYIRSEGDDSKIQQASKAIKTVFIGIGALFVGIIGIVIIIAFFNAGSAINQTPNGSNPGIINLENFFKGK